MAKSSLYDIGAYKEILLQKLLDSRDFCEVMLNKKDYTDDEVENLLYTQVFPTLYVEETQTKTLSYLGCEVNILTPSNATTKTAQLVVWIYCHKDIMKHYRKGFSGTRSDILADIVERLLCDSDDFGIGKPEPPSVQHLYPQANFYGHAMVFKIPDFRVKEREGR